MTTTSTAFGVEWVNDFKPAPLIVPIELEEKTAALWLSLDNIRATSYGSENTYYVDMFGTEFYCKDYPQHYGIVFAPSSTYQ